MAVTIQTMLESLEEILEEGVGLPLSGGKRLVDIDAAMDIIDDIRINMPSEIVQAKAIVQDRSNIISKAHREAEDIIRKAEKRASAMINHEEIVKAANEQAKEVTRNANAQAAQIKSTITKYCDDMLMNTQEQMHKNYNEVKILREKIKK